MSLRDLNQLIDICQTKHKVLLNKDEITFSDEFINEFCKNYDGKWSDDEISYSHGSYRIESSKGSADISIRWMLYVHSFATLYKMLTKYKIVLNEIIVSTGVGNLDSNTKKQILTKIPSATWQREVDAIRPGTSASIITQIDSKFVGDAGQKSYFNNFLSKPEWWNQGKNFGRSEQDWMRSSILKSAGVIQANADRMLRFIATVADDNSLRLLLRQSIKGKANLNKARKTGGQNIIFYGAPGTGKSHRIDKDELKNIDETRIIRTVFHSETQSSDFTGSLKPSMVNDDLTYEFQPGPFSIALSKALLDPGFMYYLVIEEINRAPAAAVFGEIFQLLDRDSTGKGEYGVFVSDPTQEVWLKENISSHKGKIRIPSNLTLLATMNSSDQGVMPMDTAFKRRWMFEYIPISFNNCTSGYVSIPINNKFTPVSWGKLAPKINQLLSQQRIPEDRHLGPWFVSANELIPDGIALDSSNQLSTVLIGKLFIYLWDDILRHGQRHHIFASNINTYGELVSTYTSEKNIFCEDLLTLLEDSPVP